MNAGAEEADTMQLQINHIEEEDTLYFYLSKEEAEDLVKYLKAQFKI